MPVRHPFCTYQLIWRDGHSKDFDAVLSGLIGCILDASAWLFVTSLGVAVCHHYDVLVLVVVGTAGQEQKSEDALSQCSVCACNSKSW